MSDLFGRTALVTGASRGIGRAIAIRLAARGAVVIAHFGTDRDGATATVDHIVQDGGTAYAVGAELGVDAERALPLLRDGGRIITISSVATRMANATQTSFAMTKGAVETMTLTLANQLGTRGITVNAVAPGATRTATNGPVFETPGLADLITAMTALDRLGGPGDVADVVAFLASDAARWVTGQVIDASGGLFLGPRA